MGPMVRLDWCEKSCHHRNYYSFFLSLYLFVLVPLFSLSWLFAFCLYCTTHTTQTSMPPAGFEPTNPSTLAVTDQRPRPRGQRAWHIRSPNLRTRGESLYRLSYRGPSAPTFLIPSCRLIKINYAVLSASYATCLAHH
jgi:hypothetical protein